MLAKLHDVEGLLRLKFVTNFPKDMSDDLLRAVRDLPKCAQYLHVPAQSGCNEMLKRMKRGYTVEDYREMFGRIRSTLRHPMLVAIKTWALAHLLANGMLADVVLFGGLLAWAVADRISLKRRPVRAVPAAPPMHINDLVATGLGLMIYVAFVAALHQALFGVSPLS